MADRRSEPPRAPGADFDERFWEVMARADRVLGRNPRPAGDRLPSAKASVREAERNVPLVRSAITAAVSRFEATADLIEDHFRRLRGAPSQESRAASHDAHGPTARLALIEGKIRHLERSLRKMRRVIKESADEADAWERCAMFAVERGDDTTARDALRNRRAHALQALALARDTDTGFAVLDELRRAAEELRAAMSGERTHPR